MIPFYKMQGTGNDFIVINNIELGYTHEQLSTIAQQVCQRKFSVGADALMAVDQPEHNSDFRMIFFNADGTEAEMCGNGARCIARFAYEQKLASSEMIIETIAGPVPAWRIDQRHYKVQLNSPTKIIQDMPVELEDLETIDYVELGDPGIPHVVAHYPDLAKKNLDELQATAKILRHYPAFEKGANVNFYDLSNQVMIRTFERGFEDFTLACGTGSGSTAYILKEKGLIGEQVTLQALGGQLQVEVSGKDLFLIGDTNIVVQGEITDENLK